MSVDGIGGGGRNVGGIGRGDAPVAPDAAEGARGTDKAEHASTTAAPTSLERLGRGEISLDQYLDGRVADAVRHLEGHVSGAQIEFVRSGLRESLASAPVLIELVRRATGSVPSAGAGRSPRGGPGAP